MEKNVDEVISRKLGHSEALNVRLDKTVPTGLKLTKRICNENCVFSKNMAVACHDDNSYRGTGTAISNTEFIGAVKKLFAATGKKQIIHIAGDGEPTLFRGELLDLIKKLRELPYVSSIKLTTNGTLISNGNPDLATQLKRAGLDSVNISLHSLDSGEFNRVTGLNSLGEVLKGIDCAITSGLRTTINCVVRKETFGEVEDYIRLSAAKGVKIKFLFMIGGADQAYSNNLIEKMVALLSKKTTKIYDYVDGYHAEKIFFIGDAIIEVKDPITNNCPNMKCLVRDKCLETCRYFLRITPTGSLQPCGVRNDNIIDLLSEYTSDKTIVSAIKSGGKLLGG
ncbi:MAG: radical SAM protein [Candidatus Micrarchaeota archaeon]|nr:radical SAM protein [Candidatus Micrarchaeota archaeon]